MRRLTLATLAIAAAGSGAAVQTAHAPAPVQTQAPTVRQAPPATRGTQQQAPTASAAAQRYAQARRTHRGGVVPMRGPRGAWVPRTIGGRLHFVPR
jgi:hypothetical protein